MNKEQMEYGIIRYGTPMFVFDTDILEQTVADMRECIGETAALCFAMKANPFLVKIMAALTDRIEVCSAGEFEICRATGIEPEKILISGVLKDKKEINRVLDQYGNRCIFSVESMNQFYSLTEWSVKEKKRIRIFLRLSSGDQFGMDKKTIRSLAVLHTMCPEIEIKGIHYYSGTQKRKTDMITEELCFLDVFLRGLEEIVGYQIEELEYGPGLRVSYFEGQEDSVNEDMENIRESLNCMKWKGKVTLEMGRALTACCGYYLTTIRDIKINDMCRYCIVDGGIHQLHYDGQVRGMYQPGLQIFPEKKSGAEHEWTVCGSLCSVNDVLVNHVPLKDPKTGNVLVFQRTGAYAMTEGMALFLSHDLPRVALFSEKDGWNLIRDNQPTYTWNMERK